jgi:hypothetical protein
VGHTWARGIVDQNIVWGLFLERFKGATHRIVAVCAAVQGAHRCRQLRDPILILRVMHHHDRINFSVRHKRIDRPSYNWPAQEHPPLFRHCAASARATAGRQYDRDSFGCICHRLCLYLLIFCMQSLVLTGILLNFCADV